MARLVTSACAVVIVCLGGWWLIRSPVPPVESSLPRTTASATATTTTPAVPAVAREEESAAEAGPESIDMVVHVAGAVVDPGVYRFEPGSRVADAVERAGGATGEGRPHLLNLVARLIEVAPDGRCQPACTTLVASGHHHFGSTVDWVFLQRMMLVPKPKR